MAITGTSYEELLRQNDQQLQQIQQTQALTTRRGTRYTSPYEQEIGALLGRAQAERQYTSPYAQMIDTLAGELRDSQFTYDRDTDPNYKAARKQYLLEADRTAADVLAKASAPTGGRASTYAVNAASQAADYYKSQFTSKQQELYDAAYDRYYRNYQKKLSDLEVMQGQDETAYTRWQNDYASLLQRLNVLQSQDATEYDRWKTDYQNLMQLIASTGYTPTAAELGATGMTEAEAAAWRSYYQQQLAAASGGGYSSGGGRSGGGYSSGGGAGSTQTSYAGNTYANGMTDDSIAAAAYAYLLANPKTTTATGDQVKRYLQANGYDATTSSLFSSYLDMYMRQGLAPTSNKTAVTSPAKSTAAKTTTSTAAKSTAAKSAAKSTAATKSSGGTTRTAGKLVMMTK